MTRVVQATLRPTTALHARNLETGEEAIVLTTPLDTEADPQFLNLATGWLYRPAYGELWPDPHGARRRRYADVP